MKKMIVLLLALLALTMTAVCAEEMFEVGLMEDGNCRILAYNGPGGEVVIPNEINGWPVTIILYNVFANNHDITSVTISEGVRWIQNSAFYGCDSLECVQLPSTMKCIEDQAFAYCSALKEINLHSGIKTIGENVFDGCRQLVLDAEELELYKNGGSKNEETVVKQVTGEIIDLSEYMNAGLDEIMNVVGPLEMSSESWTMYDGACYTNDIMLVYSQDDETVCGIGLIGVGNFSIKGARFDMSPEEVVGVLSAQGYTVIRSDEYNMEFDNGRETIKMDKDEEKIYQILTGWNG